MNKQIAVKTREKWVDDVKVIACILVVLGHFFQSMVRSALLKLGIGSSVIHVVLGLGISFVGPIIAA